MSMPARLVVTRQHRGWGGMAVSGGDRAASWVFTMTISVIGGGEAGSAGATACRRVVGSLLPARTARGVSGWRFGLFRSCQRRRQAGAAQLADAGSGRAEADVVQRATSPRGSAFRGGTGERRLQLSAPAEGVFAVRGVG